MMPTDSRIAFDRYTVATASRELLGNGRRVALQEKPFRLLVALLERPGQVLPRSELYDALWPADTHVDREAGLNTAVRKLRAALRETAGREDQPLETLPRLGYRLRVSSQQPPDRPVEPRSSPGARFAVRWAKSSVAPLAVGLGLVVVVALGLARFGEGSKGVSEPMPVGAQQRGRYIEARSLLAAVGGDLGRARDLLSDLVDAAPSFAPGHAYLAEASARLALQTTVALDPEEARSAARRALALEPGSAVAHRVLGMIALNFDWDVATADRRLARALALAPEDPVNHLAAATFHSALGRHDAAIEAIRRSVDLDPESMAIRSDAGFFLLRAGRFGEAATECEMVLRLDPANRYARDCLLTAYSAIGDVAAARRHAVSLLRLAGAPAAVVETAANVENPRRTYLAWKLERLLARRDRPAVRIATSYLALGDEVSALHWLEEAAHRRAPLLVFVPHQAEFAKISRKARYREILRLAGLQALTAEISLAAA